MSNSPSSINNSAIKKSHLSARDRGLIFAKQNIPKPKVKLLKSEVLFADPEKKQETMSYSQSNGYYFNYNDDPVNHGSPAKYKFDKL